MTMRANVLAAAALTVATVGGATSASAAVIPGLYNTGVDANGAKLADGSDDTHYRVLGVAPLTTTPVVYTNSLYATVGDAKFISVDGNGGSGTPATNIFSLVFDLTGFKASTATLSGAFGADNYGTVRLNGQIIAQQPAETIFENFQELTSFTATSGFIAGLNTLTFEVTDTGPPTALLVSGLSGTVAAVPEPATWGMMILGLGAVGGAMRSRRRSTKVAFAA